MEIREALRRYWDVDATTYDHAPSHGLAGPAERAAWTAALRETLPPPPSRVLDAGAGTGFLSLLAARLGHEVTALDLSTAMLGRLSEKAAAEGLGVETVTGPAEEPPAAAFDAVIERHLLWTLPEPASALQAWREAAPDGRLVLFEGLWGRVDPVERGRRRVHQLLRRVRREPDAHHRSYEERLRSALPFADGLHPDEAVAAVEAAGWRHPTLRRLRDVEWARTLALPVPERLVGVTPVYVLTAE